MLVMGGNKAVNINQYPLLRWYSQKFSEYLGRPQARLMVISSFGDAHINKRRSQTRPTMEAFCFSSLIRRELTFLDKEPARAPLRVAGHLMSSLIFTSWARRDDH